MRDLAEATGLHRNTITNIEVGRYGGDAATLETIEAVLKRAGVEFTNGDQPGVRLVKAAAGSKRTASAKPSPDKAVKAVEKKQ